MSEKVTGYLLLTTGLLTIAFTSYSVFTVLTGSALPLPQFHFEPVSLDLPTGPATLISSQDLSSFSNLTLHYFLMSFLAGVGFRLSSLGTQLLRPIEVKLKATEPK